MHFDLRSSGTLIATAIIIGAGFVAAALYSTQSVALSADQITIQRLSPDDRHLYGSPKATTIIVEFSDYQCPFCAKVHPTIKQLVDGSDGSIAWEYRHLPLEIHELALPLAALSECLADNEGQSAFWKFTDTIFTNQGKLSVDFIGQEVERLGLTEAQVDECMSDTRAMDLIDSDMKAAMALGGSGTPFSVIIFPDNSYKTVSGALPYEQWKTLLDNYGNE